MVQLSDGGEVSILIAESVAQEYQVEEKTKDGVTTCTCFVEAKGEEFKIRLAKLPVSQNEKLDFKVYLDDAADDLCRCNAGEKAMTCSYDLKGFKRAIAGAQVGFKAFTFAKMQLTSEGVASTLTNLQLDSACTVRIEIERMIVVGPKKHPKPSNTSSQEQVPQFPVYNEDSKIALLGLKATKVFNLNVEDAGRNLPTEERYACRCMTINDPNASKIVVRFKYLNHRMLEARGLKERARSEVTEGVDDDEIQIDTHRTERQAAKRRAREQAEQGRNIRVKREVQVKREVKVEDANAIDLTTDGEPVRRAALAIVVDDSEEELD